MSVFVSKEQYMRACSVDLYEFLLQSHPKAVKPMYGSVVLLADKHISVKRGFHGYMDFQTGDTGNNVDYLMNFLGYTYPEAVLALLGEAAPDCNYSAVVNPPIPDAPKEITLPKPLNGPYHNLYAYLSARKIPSAVIQRLIDEGIMYQSAEGNNIVFCSPAGDYCEIRGTNSYADRRCKKRADCGRFHSGSHGWCTQMYDCHDYKPDPFHGCRKTRPDRFWYFSPDKDTPSKVVYVCEAAIDAVSLYVILQRQNKCEAAVYVSIGGVANQKAIDRLKRAKKVILAVDNDPAGQECRDRNPELQFILPAGKDWNDDLKKGDF